MKIVIGNSCDDDIGRPYRRSAGEHSQVALWFANAGDVVVLASNPDLSFLEYLSEVTEIPTSSLNIVVPEGGVPEDSRLSESRLRSPSTLANIHDVLGNREPTEVLSIWPSAYVARLASDLSLESRYPGHGFLSQGGARFMTSKCCFRAVAAAQAVPISEGAVAHSVEDAVPLSRFLLEGNPHIMVKFEYGFGSFGNEVLTQIKGFVPGVGTRCTYLDDLRDLDQYFHENWNRLTDGGAGGLAIEVLHPNARAAFAEVSVSDAGVEFLCDGGLEFSPLPVAEPMPAEFLPESTRAHLRWCAEQLGAAAHQMGYRGVLCTDVITVGETGTLYATEWNGRRTTCTHIHEVIGKQIIGQSFGHGRFLRSCFSWNSTSFSAARDLIERSGLAYDRESKIGVILTTPYNSNHRTMGFCVVGETPDHAVQLEDATRALTTQME